MSSVGRQRAEDDLGIPRRGRRFAGDADSEAKGDQMHQCLAADTMALDRWTSPEGRRPADDVVMDLRPRRIPADDEILVLQGLPMDRVAIGKSMVLGQSRENPRLPQHDAIAV